jgi:hypothetical protein
MTNPAKVNLLERHKIAKNQHWRAFSAIFASEGPPMLETAKFWLVRNCRRQARQASVSSRQVAR